MPNQRKKGKKGISVYVPEDIKNALVHEAERLGIPMSELVTRIYRDALEQRGYQITKGDEL